MTLPSLQIRFQGESPLICHNGQLANPQNSYAKAMKAVSGKRKKVDADFEELARLEWLASLYRSGGDLVIPDFVLEAVLINGAKKTKRGPQAKTGLFCTQHASLHFPDKPPGPIDDPVLNEMYESGKYTLSVGVKVNMAKVMRTRPIFRDWACIATIQYDPDVLDVREISQILTDAGRLVGIGDWRPKHGRFKAEILEFSDLAEEIAAKIPEPV